MKAGWVHDQCGFPQTQLANPVYSISTRSHVINPLSYRPLSSLIVPSNCSIRLFFLIFLSDCIFSLDLSLFYLILYMTVRYVCSLNVFYVCPLIVLSSCSGIALSDCCLIVLFDCTP